LIRILPHQLTEEPLEHPPKPMLASQQQAEDDTRDGGRGPDNDGQPHVHLLVTHTGLTCTFLTIGGLALLGELLFEVLARFLRLSCLLLGLFQPFLEPFTFSSLLASIRVSRLVATTRERDSKSNR
jgi:hypothetical protein